MGCGLSGPLYQSTGGMPDFSGLGEGKVRTNGHPVEISIIQTHPICLRKQGVNFESAGRSVR
jgi:hypothetical protein